MASDGYWVEISQHGMRLGAGFLLTSRFVVTALHCLRGATVGDDVVNLSFPAGQNIPGRVHERSETADLALIDVTEPGPAVVPHADRCEAGAVWRAPYRPSITDPYLSGGVLHSSVSYQCEGGDAIEALQLGCVEHLGDYSGYSGGPVERSAGDENRAVLGILMEQYPDRQDPQRASDVLFAATVAEALRRFSCFDVGHLLKVLCPTPAQAPRGAAATTRHEPGTPVPIAKPSHQGRPPSVPAKSLVATGRLLLGALRDWGACGLLDEAHVSVLQLRVAKSVIDGALGDDAYE
jgi:Trypsin-like peptidase domain